MSLEIHALISRDNGGGSISWHTNKFLNRVQDGAVLPILHLNGDKIANPTALGRMSDTAAPRRAKPEIDIDV